MPSTEQFLVHDDAATLVTAAVAWFLDRIEDAQAAGEVPHVALTGGTVADEFHRALASAFATSGVDLGAVHWWFGDERFVAADSPDRNAGQARAALLGPLGIADHLVHEIPSSEAVASVEEAARAYADDLAAHAPAFGPRFCVVLLGMGPDAHVASLFPGHASLDAEGLSVPETDSPKPPAQRVSLTFAALNDAASVGFLVSGAGKADALAAARAEGPVSDAPARGVRGQRETVWFVDADAARTA